MKFLLPCCYFVYGSGGIERLTSGGGGGYRLVFWDLGVLVACVA